GGEEEIGGSPHPFANRWRVGVQVDENHWSPRVDAHRKQTELGLIKIGLMTAQGGGLESSVESVGPSVIATRQARIVARLLDDRMPWVSRYLPMGSPLTVCVSDSDPGPPPRLAHDRIARAGQLGGEPEELPGAPEDPLALVLKDLGGGVPIKGQCPAGIER